jgi:hypothetical protein
MTSQSRPEIPGSFRFEFDPVNNLLLARLEGRLTEDSILEFYKAIQRHAVATDAGSGIWDCSAVTEFAPWRIWTRPCRTVPALVFL